MARKYRCRYTEVRRCESEATERLRLTFSIVSEPQLTRVCAAHGASLETTCQVAGIKFERI
jgi:hypothetical protein